MLILCHRGYHHVEHENTLEAFAQAPALGADGVETDVRLSADRLPILFHDRVVGGGTAVASLARAELSRAVGYHVPTLDEALARGPELFWNIEIKTPDAVEATVRILRRPPGDPRKLLVTSFRHDVVAQVGEELPVDCGVLVDHRPYDTASFLVSLPRSARMTTIVWDYETIDPDVLLAATRAGLKNFAYGASTEREHRHCRELGLAGLITDSPTLVSGVRDGPGQGSTR